MSCECHRIGGRFIAEDPDCPAHGREAQRAEQDRSVIVEQLRSAMRSGDADRIEQAAFVAMEYLESL